MTIPLAFRTRRQPARHGPELPNLKMGFSDYADHAMRCESQLSQDASMNYFRLPS